MEIQEQCIIPCLLWTECEIWGSVYISVDDFQFCLSNYANESINLCWPFLYYHIEESLYFIYCVSTLKNVYTSVVIVAVTIRETPGIRRGIRNSGLCVYCSVYRGKQEEIQALLTFPHCTTSASIIVIQGIRSCYSIDFHSSGTNI